jgi:hypothetical protein
MKNTILISLLFIATFASAQQTEVRGIVSIHNSETETGKREYVPNATVEDDFAKARAAIEKW